MADRAGRHRRPVAPIDDLGLEEAARILGDILPTIVSPQLPKAWWLYGDALAHIGRLEEAATALTRSHTIDPDRWSTWKSLGSVYAALDRLERSREAVLRATQLHQDDAALWSNLGVIERKLGKPESTILRHQQAIAADPNFAPAWHNLGNRVARCGGLGGVPSRVTSNSSNCGRRPSVIGLTSESDCGPTCPVGAIARDGLRGSGPAPGGRRHGPSIR